MKKELILSILLLGVFFISLASAETPNIVINIQNVSQLNDNFGIISISNIWERLINYGYNFNNRDLTNEMATVGCNQIHSTILLNNSLFAGCRETIPKIVKFNDLNDLTNQTVITLPLVNSRKYAESVTYSERYNRLFFLSGGTKTNIIEMNPNTLEYTEYVLSETTVGDSGGIAVDNDFIYIVSYEFFVPMKVYKYYISNKSLAMVITPTINGDNLFLGHDIELDNGYLHITGANFVLTLNKTDLSQINSFKASPSDGISMLSDDMANTPNRIFTSIEGGSSAGKILMYEKDSGDYQILNPVIRNSNGSVPVTYGCEYNRYDRLVYCVYNSYPGQVLKIDPTNLEMRIIYFNETIGQNYLNEIKFDGDRMFLTVWSSPAKIFKTSTPKEYDKLLLGNDFLYENGTITVDTIISNGSQLYDVNETDATYYSNPFNFLNITTLDNLIDFGSINSCYGTSNYNCNQYSISSCTTTWDGCASYDEVSCGEIPTPGECTWDGDSCNSLCPTFSQESCGNMHEFINCVWSSNLDTENCNNDLFCKVSGDTCVVEDCSLFTTNETNCIQAGCNYSIEINKTSLLMYNTSSSVWEHIGVNLTDFNINEIFGINLTNINNYLFGKDVLPIQDSLFSIGSPSFKWLSGNFVNLISDAINTINLTAKNITTNALLLNPSNTNVSINGEVRYNNETKDLEVYTGIRSPVVTTMFSQYGDQRINNTNVETTMFDGGRGTLTIPANYCYPGKTFRVKSSGYVSISSGNTATLKTKLGDTLLTTSSASAPSTFTDNYYDLEWIMTFRTCGNSTVNGTVVGGGRSLIEGGQGFATNTMRSFKTLAPISVNTTKDNNINLTYQFQTASTSDYLVITTGTIEVLN